MAMEMGVDERRIVRLSCPSLSMTVPFVAREDEHVDIGSIARTFALEPSTVKLNGHFISRGVDLISSSVTWKSILSFFSAKGLPTGKSDEDALVVDGKLCKVGVKRIHGEKNIINGDCCKADGEDTTQTSRINLVKNKKLKSRDSGRTHVGLTVSKCNHSGSGCKRKQYMEDVILLKKLKINDSISVVGEIIVMQE